jgi:hypothetical protein
MPLEFEITFVVVFFVVTVLLAGAAKAGLDRVLAQYRQDSGDASTSATDWSRRVEAARTRIEAQSLRRFMRGEPPLDKDAELKRALGITERA